MIRISDVIRRFGRIVSSVPSLLSIVVKLPVFIVAAGFGLTTVTSMELISCKGLVSVAMAQETWLESAKSMPKIKYAPPKPELPDELVEQAEGTKCVIRLYIDEKGEVNRKLTKIKESSGYPQLDKLVLEWGKQIKFRPALNAGRPVKVRMDIPIRWKSKKPVK